MALGHFKRQCNQIYGTCKTCGEQCADRKIHNCSQIEKCVHCQQNHKSNSLKSPVGKSFRIELTKKLLNLNNHPTTSSSSYNNNNNNNIRKYIYDISNFPPLPTAQVLTNNPMMIKLDDLMTKMSEIKDQISNAALKHEKFEQFILEKNQNDKRIEEHLDTVTKNTVALKKDVVQHSLLVERHENLFMKVLLPIFEDLFTVICTQNQDKKGNPLDADLKYKLERYRVQMKKASEGKLFF
ncbi:unnamed protein product [Rotaria sordida]|uniref:Uncharacterized protein n=1 Tax=Rotaria sordida TaxID=392033 RepID=A0A813UTA1_9BILA|nr:unnamed protein product [Rotaria sordida]CAF3949212.1 unnamed protein product [Rotaria sordida]